MKNLKSSLFFGITFMTCLVLGQTGPGGIGTSSENNFWLDANSLALLDGESVSQFFDVSGNSKTFTQLNSSKQPVYQTNVVNGMPVVRFDGTDDNLLSSSISDLESANVTWFVVYKQNVQKTCGIIGGDYDSEYRKWRSYALSNGVFKSVHFSPTIKHVGYTDNLSSFNFSSSHITPTDFTVYKEGNLMQTKSATYTTPVGHNFVTLGSFTSNNHYLNGDVAEAFVFNTSLNDLERVIIENYLGAKYNLAIPQDFYSFQTSHKYGLIGIGNNGVNSHVNSTGVGVLTASSPTSLSSDEYLFIGHDGVDLATVVNGDMPIAVSTHSRLSRTWRSDETGDLGNVTLEFDVLGSANFAETDTYNLLVDLDADGDFSNASVVSGVFNAGVMTFTLDLPSGATFTLSGVPSVPAAIHSITSGSWYTSSTWDCDCIPTLTDTVYVEPTHNVNVDGAAFVYNLNIELGGTLEMSEDHLMSLQGDLNIDGGLNFTNGELGFEGGGVQNLSGNGNTHNLFKVLINNDGVSDITFTNGEFIVNDVLTPQNGSLVIDNSGGGTLIFNSTSATTGARIGVLTPTVSITGNVSARRFLPAGVAGERTISSPVVGADLSEWDATISISGEGFPDGCATGNEGCYFSCKQMIGGTVGGDYIDVTNPNELLVSGVGYELYIGDNLTSFSGAMITSTGTVRNHEEYTLNFPTIKSGWNIVGNPYVSPILFSEISTNYIGNYFYVYDAATGSYQWYDGASNTSSIAELSNGRLAIGQGFWIYGGGVPSLTFSQALKTTSDATFIRNSTVDKSIYLTLSEEGTTFKNTAGIAFNDFSNDLVDSLDVKYLTMANQKASSLIIQVEEEKLSKNYLSSDNRDKVVNLSVNILNDGYFTIDIKNIENVGRYSNITLLDKMTGTIIDLRSSHSYTFYANEGEENRFHLILSNKTVESSGVTYENGKTDSGVTITQLGNAINIEAENSIAGVTEVSVVNLLGQQTEFSELIELYSGSNMVFVPKHVKGVYLVVVKSQNGVQTKKIIL